MPRKVDYLLLGIAIIAIITSGIGLSITTSNSDQISELSAKIEELKPAPGPKEVTVKIGAPVALTGWVAFCGKAMKAGYNGAVRTINEEGGIPLGENTVAKLEVITVDTESTPAGARKAAKELIDLYEVDIMMATETPSTTRPLLPEVKRANLFLMYGCGSEHPYIKEETVEMGIPLASTWTSTTHPEYPRLGRLSGSAMWLVERVGPRVTHLEANVEWSRRANEYVREGVEEAGGTWLGSVTYEAGAEDLSPQISEIKQKDPDVVIASTFGPLQFTFIKQCRDAGLLPEEVAILDIGAGWPTWVGKEYVGPDVMTNAYFYTFFSWSMCETAKQKEVLSKERLDAWEEARKDVLKAGASPFHLNGFGSTAYESILVLSKIIEKAGSTDTEDLASAASELTVEELNKDKSLLYKYISPTPPFDEGPVWDELGQVYQYLPGCIWRDNYELEFIEWINSPEKIK